MNNSSMMRRKQLFAGTLAIAVGEGRGNRYRSEGPDGSDAGEEASARDTRRAEVGAQKKISRMCATRTSVRAVSMSSFVLSISKASSSTDSIHSVDRHQIHTYALFVVTDAN